MQIFSDKVFKNPIKTIMAFDSDSFKKAFLEIEKLKEKYYLLGYIRYEAKDIFLGKNVDSKFPILFFQAFEDYSVLKPPPETTNIFLLPEKTISYKTYSENIKKIKEYISEGHTYEVNYTYSSHVYFGEDTENLFFSLLKRQKTPYCALIKNDYDEILSFSPELFFELDGNKIRTKPMKGTIKRGETEQEDNFNIEFLKKDPKNKAENVMIVDLLRNDLGKIAKTGSVKVNKLFEIETHSTLHQMTSEIEAELKDETTLFEIFEAIFPCGSITGAPKIRTMEIIGEIEEGKRDIYCGAIGLISKDKATFSVPIRTLQRKKNDSFFDYKIGGAIVWDSNAEDEWDETLVKTSFLTSNHNELKLIETIKIKNKKPLFFSEHLQRLKKTASTFDFDFNEELYNLKFEEDGMLRLLLSKDGSCELQLIPLKESTTNKVKMSKLTVNSKNPFLLHKTTYRPYYEKSMEKISANEIYDEIFINEKGEITEGARTNIVLNLEGKLYTPPLSCGCLNGIYRQDLLKKGKCKERILYKSDLLNAKEIFCVNSVRGMKRVEYDPN